MQLKYVKHTKIIYIITFVFLFSNLLAFSTGVNIFPPQKFVSAVDKFDSKSLEKTPETVGCSTII